MIEAHLVFDLELHLHPQEETAPYLHLWLTRNTSNSLATLPIRVQPQPNKPGLYLGHFDVTINYAPLRADSLDPRYRQDGPAQPANLTVAAAAPIGKRQQPQPILAEQSLAQPVDVLAALSRACLNVDAFSMITNDHFERCCQQAGVARVALAELFGQIGQIGQNGQEQNRQVAARLTLPMLDSGEGRAFADKGLLTFYADQCSLKLDGRDVRQLMAARSPPLQWVVPHRPLNPCAAYINLCRRDFRAPALPATWKSMEDVNIFEYVCRVGVLPAAAYINAARGYTGEAYFRNAALLALRRMVVTEQQALQWQLSTSERDCRHASYWLAHTLSLYVQYSDYVSDVVFAYDNNTRSWEKVPVEYFYNARVRGGQGDCEDLSLEFMIMAQELKRLQTSDPLLQMLKRVLQDGFYLVMLLAGISGAEINLQNEKADLGAHMNAALVNKRKLSNWAAKSGRPLCKEHGPTAQELDAARLYPPMVMLEGTGPLDPNGIENARGDQDAEAMAGAAFRRYELVDKQARPMFHYSAAGDESVFYKTVNVMLTDALLKEGCGQAVWALCQRNQRSKQLTCSVEFRTIAAASDDIIALAEPELSTEQLSTIDHYMLDLHPTPSLEPPALLPGQPVMPHIVRAREQARWLEQQLEAMRTAAMLAGPGASGASGGQGRPMQVIRLAKYAHFDERRAFVQQFVSGVRDMLSLSPPGNKSGGAKRQLRSFEVREEPVTVDRGGFFITLNF